MKEIPIKKYIRYLFIIAILIFFFNKFYIRPWVLNEGIGGVLLVFTYSVPNLIEAIVGTLIITGILLQLRALIDIVNVKDLTVSAVAVILAAIYVISQELKLHNIGGNNVYDPNDLIASLIGLIGTFIVINLFGFIDVERNV